MMQHSKGFTLMEMVVVIVVIGILVAFAVPRYINFTNGANQAAVNAVAGALGAGSSTNYGVRKASPTAGFPITNCQNVAQTLPGGVLPTGYTITSQAITAEQQVTCTVTGGNSLTATFVAIGIS